MYLKTETYVFSYIFAVYDTLDKKLYYYYYLDSPHYEESNILGVDYPHYTKMDIIVVRNAESEKHFRTIDFSENNPEEKIKTLDQWHVLPLPDECKTFVYGSETDEDPLFSVRKGNKLYSFPVIEEGYYFYLEDYKGLDYFFAMYDSKEKKLYCYYCMSYLLDFS